GTSNSGTTNVSGEASFTYTGTSSAGTDVIVARFIDSTGNRQTSNKLQKTWVMRGEGIVLTQSSSISPVGTPHTVTALVVNDLSQAVSGRVVDFQVISGPNAGTSNSGTTNANGEASFTYTGTGSVGTDAIVARFIDSTGNPRRSNEVQKMWVLDVPNPRGGAPLSCRGATCSIPLTCPLSPALGISCINEARVLVARRFLPRRSARSSTDTAAKARRRMIVFASGIANIPPAATQDVPLRRTRTGKQIARSGRRKLVGVIEIRSSAGTSISSTPITIRIRRR
ncbi:MAG: Ig-like domain-containing protein, partial [Pseudomonadota bacterium]|nr:Ig-like domain-containing protein [Pseudomonadota bacterium]